MPASSDPTDPINQAAKIVSAFVGNNSLPRAELPALLESVHAALVRISAEDVAPAASKALVPAVSINKSVTPEFIVCLEDGKKFKSLKRHLSALGMTSDQYREKWKLPADYPMVTSNYSAQRSALAKSSGLGQMRRKSTKTKTKKASAPKATITS
jgi:predicted transcriptional regulator